MHAAEVSLAVTNGFGPTGDPTSATTFSVRDDSAVGALVPIGVRLRVVGSLASAGALFQFLLVGRATSGGDGLATGCLRDATLTVGPGSPIRV